LMRGFGFKNKTFRGFSPFQEVPKTFFEHRQPMVLHNLGLDDRVLTSPPAAALRLDCPGGLLADDVRRHGCLDGAVFS
jgi:hypothetical protein